MVGTFASSGMFPCQFVTLPEWLMLAVHKEKTYLKHGLKMSKLDKHIKNKYVGFLH